MQNGKSAVINNITLENNQNEQDNQKTLRHLYNKKNYYSEIQNDILSKKMFSISQEEQQVC